jgi:microcystin-dependent protein
MTTKITLRGIARVLPQLALAGALLFFATTWLTAQFPSQREWCGTSGGSSNAQTITCNQYTQFEVGVPIRFKAGFLNTGPTTLAINSLAATAIARPSGGGGGNALLGGGEIVNTMITTVVYDGSVFQITNSYRPEPTGTVIDFAGAAGCPAGFSESTGASVATANQPTLSAVLSTSWGAPGGGNFSLPDLRGRGTFSRDSGGSGRITAAAGNADGTVVGTTTGRQSYASGIPQTNLQSFALAGSHAYTSSAITGVFPSTTTTFGTTAFTVGSAVAAVTTSGGISNVTNPTVGVTVNGSDLSSGGSGTAFPTLSNAGIVIKCVRQ